MQSPIKRFSNEWTGWKQLRPSGKVSGTWRRAGFAMRVKRWKGFESNLAYRVEITDSALADAEQYVHFIQEEKQEPEAAERWFRGLVKAMLALQELPHRFPVIPGPEEFNLELRQAIYYSHRIIFRVDKSTRLVT